MLPLTGGTASPQGHQYSKSRMQAGELCQQLVRSHGRTAGGITIGEHDAARSLRDEVAASVATVHARLPEGRDGDVDEPGMQLAQVLIAEPEPRQFARLPIFYQHVGTPGEGA